MLNFLRNLRKSTTSKYLKYAIGEIILVVIGILIALSIDNWNNQRIQKNAEKIYMTKLLEEVITMNQIYTSQLKENPFFIEETRQVLFELQNCQLTEDGKTMLEEVLKSHQVLPSLYKASSTYEEMVSSGAMARIENEVLKNAIISLYSNFDRAIDVLPYFRSDLSRASQIIWERVSFSMDNEGVLHADYNFNELCNDSLLKNAFIEILDSREDYIQIARLINSSLSELKEQLNQYLQ